ncbi:MAG: hypothetical protein LBQ77_01290 [Treponema sp.]|nr:hypothetical protein [Treponema sp.]
MTDFNHCITNIANTFVQTSVFEGLTRIQKQKNNSIKLNAWLSILRSVPIEQQLKYTCELHAITVVTTNPRYPSKQC